MCVCLQHLAVVVGGVDADFEDMEQRVHQTFAATQLTPRLLPCWAQVPHTHTHTHEFRLSCSVWIPPQGGLKTCLDTAKEGADPPIGAPSSCLWRADTRRLHNSTELPQCISIPLIYSLGVRAESRWRRLCTEWFPCSRLTSSCPFSGNKYPPVCLRSSSKMFNEAIKIRFDCWKLFSYFRNLTLKNDGQTSRR